MVPTVGSIFKNFSSLLQNAFTARLSRNQLLVLLAMSLLFFNNCARETNAQSLAPANSTAVSADAR